MTFKNEETKKKKKGRGVLVGLYWKTLKNGIMLSC